MYTINRQLNPTKHGISAEKTVRIFTKNWASVHSEVALFPGSSSPVKCHSQTRITDPVFSPTAAVPVAISLRNCQCRAIRQHLSTASRSCHDSGSRAQRPNQVDQDDAVLRGSTSLPIFSTWIPTSTFISRIDLAAVPIRNAMLLQMRYLRDYI